MVGEWDMGGLIVVILAVVGTGLMVKLFWRAWFLTRGSHQEPEDGETWACAECGYDLRATRDRCPECGTVTRWARLRALREDWPDEPAEARRPEEGEQWVAVYETGDPIVGGMVLEHLQARGIMAQLELAQERVGIFAERRIVGTNTVAVRSGDAQRAQQIIRHLLALDLESAWPLGRMVEADNR